MFRLTLKPRTVFGSADQIHLYLNKPLVGLIIECYLPFKTILISNGLGGERRLGESRSTGVDTIDSGEE